VLEYLGLSPAERAEKRPRLYGIDGGKAKKTTSVTEGTE